MDCFTHPLAAIGICKHCGRGLCHDCVAAVELSLACKGRCETHVAALNELTQRAKTAHEKAAGAYTKTAIFMALAGLLFTGFGAIERSRDGFIPLSLGILFLLCSGFYFHSAKRYWSRD